ncbi:SMI1/KNR4 family protein [Lentzea sp. NPDC102401]|uniref:SMI1/KNR4 family protein n=1 Tax=Lentzea sp. NPDC102401 TaxID=3364128 RepID=UPI00380EB938
MLRQEPKGVPEQAWAEAEEHLGFVFPDDYKHLMSALGNGVFDHVVEVISPVADEDSLSNYLSDAYDTPDGLVPWGRADRGCILFWRAEGPPDEWTITFGDADFREWESYDGPMTAFLHDLLTGKITSRLIEFTPTPNPGFWPS